jgi:hypothetical protein
MCSCMCVCVCVCVCVFPLWYIVDINRKFATQKKFALGSLVVQLVEYFYGRPVLRLVSHISKKINIEMPFSKLNFRNLTLYVPNVRWTWNPVIYEEYKSHGIAVGIATGYRLDDRGIWVRVPVGSRMFTSPYRPELLWGPTSLLCNRYRGIFPRW